MGPMGAAMGQQWACMRAYMAIYGGSNGAYMRAYMAIYGGSNGACIRAYIAIYGGIHGPHGSSNGAAMGHACAHTWPYMGQGRHLRKEITGAVRLNLNYII